ncbi:HAMP domain-containing sensor histidine kinase [Lysinibacillus sp. CNPSo 3705]|uniref:vancomycin resistance histidine kinase VanS n=1 Tax=Lysinibacillus sp. CNPSo 3705 TaxID=3028148 RepID=UPI0023631CCE|nr:vancomycin resistance histidine kinase VanS [Lysinibacillus sp. CNPSo 3705]MDD1504982.1 HAMP domain-containing sensor histidine kinase [Lysinibacillus sp. CNPSo 3705]
MDYNREYKELRNKLFSRAAIIVFSGAVILFLLFSVVLEGRFANGVVWFLNRVLKIDYDVAMTVYQQIFGNNKELIMLAACAGVFFILLRFYLNQFTKYFIEVNRGIDALIREDTGDVILSRELSATEKKINQIKHTLEKRKVDTQLAEQRKNDLIVYLAHDLKTPLTSVIGYLTLLRDENQISEELREKYLSISLDKAERLEDLINEFFEITRFNLSNITLEYSKVNLTRMLEQFVFEFRPMFATKNLTCTLHAAPDIMLKCDVDKVQRVFDNLLRNAVNYSFEDTAIEVSAEQDDSYITLKFTNRGNTIPEEKLGRIFEQFYRLDTARSSNSGGAGVGLAIAKEIVELHQGTISAYSENELTCFEVTFPLS